MTTQNFVKNSPPKSEEEKVEAFENLVPGLSSAEYEVIRSSAIEKSKNVVHRWRQRGPWLNCTSCETPHASWVGTQVRMVGEKPDGTPIFTKVLTAQVSSA